MAVALQSQRTVALRSAPLCGRNPARTPAVTDRGPHEWPERLAAYQAARTAEYAYSEGQIDPHFKGVNPSDREAWSIAGASVTEAMWEELERLGEVRSEAEDALMECPSPDAEAFAFKYAVAHGNGRKSVRWNNMLEAEAKRFSGRAAQ